MVSTSTQTKHHLDRHHRKELFEKRGLNSEWIEVNCRTVNSKEASELLGYKAPSDGIWLEGTNFQGQFKPDKPWKSKDEKGKAPKYRSGLGEYDAMLPIHPTISNYWDDLEALKLLCYIINGVACILLTEGFFKAIAGCSNGIPTIALLGVEMGLTPSSADPQGKRYLVSILERFARAGFGFIHALDADCATNKSVLMAQLKLAHQLKKFNVPQYSVTGLWAQEDGKGMDDYIKNHGADKFRQEVLAKAVDIEVWEQQFKQDFSTDKIAWTQASLSEFVAEEYRHKLAWHVGNKAWYWYNRKLDGVWSPVSDEMIGRLVVGEAKSKLGATFKHDFIGGTIKLLKYDLAVEDWEEKLGLIPLQDCVLDPATMKTYPHNPGYRFLWQLPYKWKDRAIGCQSVLDWFHEFTLGDADLVQMHRAYLKAVVTGRYDLQRFLELIGPGGTGKGTLQRLAMALVGEENTQVTTLKQLEGNRFETASLYGKRLVIITDSERYGGEVSTLKALTGQDPIRNERKGIQQTRGFTFTGMIMVAANEAIQSSDYTSGLKRRRLTVPCTNQIPADKRRDLDEEFKPYLPGVLQWVLEMPDAEMVRLVRDTENSVPKLAHFSAEFLLDTNPLADWMDNCLVLEPNAKTYVGTLSKSADMYLYPSYCRWMEETGSRAVSLRRFSECLSDLCRNQLKLPEIKKGRDNQGAFFTGLSVRQPGLDNDRPITGGDGLVTGQTHKSDESVTGQTEVSDGSDGCDGSNQSLDEKFLSFQIEKKIDREMEAQTSHPSHPSPTRVSPVTQPITQSVTNDAIATHQSNTNVAEATLQPDPELVLVDGRKIASLELVGKLVRRDGEVFEVNALGWDNQQMICTSRSTGNRAIFKSVKDLE